MNIFRVLLRSELAGGFCRGTDTSNRKGLRYSARARDRTIPNRDVHDLSDIESPPPRPRPIFDCVSRLFDTSFPEGEPDNALPFIAGTLAARSGTSVHTASHQTAYHT